MLKLLADVDQRAQVVRRLGKGGKERRQFADGADVQTGSFSISMMMSDRPARIEQPVDVASEISGL